MTLQSLSDKTAISLSALCTLHCLALPFILVVFPNIAALQLDNEAFHLWMIIAVVPISAYALTMGCRRHRQKHVVALGILGLALLVGAIVVGHSLYGEIAEKALTLAGAALIALGHFRNYRLCQQRKACECSKESDTVSAINI